MSPHLLFPIVVLSALTALSACSRPAPAEMTGDFETLSLATIENPGCVFHQADAADEDDAIVFATYAGNLDHIAVVRFKGETIKLVPKVIPDMTVDTFDVTYEVIDYLNWQVQATATDGVGQLQLIQRDEPTAVVTEMRGSCVA
jgi:hypothetical protein